MSAEERESLTKSLFSDYIASPNINEALAAAQELLVPDFAKTLVIIGCEKAFDCLEEKEQNAIVEVMVELTKRGAIPKDALIDGIGEMTSMLEDLALDFPSATRILGRTLGLAAADGLVGLDVVVGQAEGTESAEPRRAFIAAALRAAKEKNGADGLTKLCTGLKFGAALEHDPEFDGELPSAAEFLDSQGLQGVPL